MHSEIIWFATFISSPYWKIEEQVPKYISSFTFQILPAAKDYTTTKRNGCVKLRKEESGLGSEEPISVPTLLQDAAAAYPDVSF